MSKKDYELIAGVLRAHALDGEVRVLEVARSLAVAFSLSNPRFNERRFMEAVLAS